MSEETTIRYYVRWDDWAETIPLSLYRTLHEGHDFPVDEQGWNKTDRIWMRTTRVTESMFEDGDVEKVTPEFAKKHFPEAFAV
jgi:hypothetical protein